MSDTEVLMTISNFFRFFFWESFSGKGLYFSMEGGASFLSGGGGGTPLGASGVPPHYGEP